MRLLDFCVKVSFQPYSHITFGGVYLTADIIIIIIIIMFITSIALFSFRYDQKHFTNPF